MRYRCKCADLISKTTNHQSADVTCNVSRDLSRAISLYLCSGELFSPIISPGVNCLVITPIAPHTLYLRPIVVDSNAKIKILSKNNIGNISISSDGQTKYNVYKNSLITIININCYALFISVPGINNFYLKLRKKIGWR